MSDRFAIFPGLRRKPGQKVLLLFLALLLAAGGLGVDPPCACSAIAAESTRLPVRPRSRTSPVGPDSGGPAGDNGAIAIPKKAEKPDVPPPPPEPKVKNPAGLQNFSLRVDVPEVTLNVGVILQKTHEFVPNLQPVNFRVYEDGVAAKDQLAFNVPGRRSRRCCCASLPPPTIGSFTT